MYKFTFEKDVSNCVTISSRATKRPWDNPSSNNRAWWRCTAAVMGPLKIRRASPPVFRGEHMFACLLFCQQPPPYSGKDSGAWFTEGGELFPCQPGPLRRLISQQCTTAVLPVNMGMKNALFGGRCLRSNTKTWHGLFSNTNVGAKLVKVFVGVNQTVALDLCLPPTPVFVLRREPQTRCLNR